MQKFKETAGADELTPSRAQYFSWVNSTNEGSTEAQTLTNLEFFKFMRDRFGMQLDIYAWDAGNLDGSGGLYAAQRMDALTKQYPNGYTPIADAAAEIVERGRALQKAFAQKLVDGLSEADVAVFHSCLAAIGDNIEDIRKNGLFPENRR